MPHSERSWSDHFYRSADDRLDLYARDYPGTGPTLLMMHGLTRNSADFEPLIAGLPDSYRIVTVDQRGRGRSDYDPEPANYLPDIYVADMFALLDGLGIDEVTAIGTSMGGLMAMIMGAMQPDRLRAIIINDIGPEVDPAGIARIQSYVGNAEPLSSWEDAAQACRDINSPAFPKFADSDWMDFARRTYVEEGGSFRPAYDPGIATSMEGDQPATVPPDLWPMWDMLASLPILLLRGGISDILHADTAAKMEARHSGYFQRVDVPDVGHAPVLDEPEALSAIRDFLHQHAN
ncbi:MAG: alpha/beta hydrolase [Pseudomonadota bacterium]